LVDPWSVTRIPRSSLAELDVEPRHRRVGQAEIAAGGGADGEHVAGGADAEVGAVDHLAGEAADWQRRDLVWRGGIHGVSVTGRARSVRRDGGQVDRYT
jgi:hypothetical protein